MAGREEVVNPLGDLLAVGLALLDRLGHADGVHGLEGAHLPAESGAQGVIDAVGLVGDFGDAVGDVGKHVAEDAAVEGAGLVAAVIQDAGPGGQVVHRLGGVEGGVIDLRLRPVFERREVQAEDGLLAVHLGLLVEALSGFAAEVAVVDQVLHEGGRLENGFALVVGAIVLDAIGHMDQRVEAHHIAGAERGALRAAHRRAGELVHRLDAQPHVLHGVEQCLDGKHAHAVRNERRGVLAEHGGLAQAVAAVGHEEVDQLRGAAGVRDDLQ